MRLQLTRVSLAAARIWLGYQWLHSGLGKLSNPAWMQTGTAIRGFWMRAAGMVPGTPAAIKYSWYQKFIETLVNGNHHTWFSPFIVIGEILVGAGLILGSFTLLAAFMGGLMNLNFMLAGSASTNPVMYTLALLLVYAGTNLSGYYGLDTFLMPRVRKMMPKLSLRPATVRGSPAPQPQTSLTEAGGSQMQ
ncbi:MAG: DoxX family membrane protein [Bacillota bacterium]|nr:DoxX family membrane protein [Bacillota bacterium]